MNNQNVDVEIIAEMCERAMETGRRRGHFEYLLLNVGLFLLLTICSIVYNATYPQQSDGGSCANNVPQVILGLFLLITICTIVYNATYPQHGKGDD